MARTAASQGFVLRRPRLIAALDQLAEGGVAVISAPSGFGKTTLLRTWAATGSSATAMVRLRDSDNDPLVLARHIWAEWTATTAGGRCRIHRTGTLSDPSRLGAVLALHAAECPAHHALVLDDVQLLSHPAASGLVQQLLEQEDRQLRLVLACREDPPLPWLQLNSQGRLLTIRSADLAFDRQELRSALNAVPGLNATDDLVEATARTTHGWPAGVRIAALEAATASDPLAAVTSPGLSQQFAQHYFEPEVLRNLPPDTVEFLESTSVLDDLRPELCDALTGRTDAADVLLDLANRGIFTERSSDALGSFAYHPLFRDALSARLQLRDESRRGQVLRYASRWYEEAGLPAEAVEYALRARDWTRATSLVTNYSDQALANGQVTTVARWIEAFPASVLRADLELTLLEASVFMLLFDPGRFRDAMRRADRLVAAADAGTAAATRPVLLFMQANDALYRGRLSDTVPPLESALVCLRTLSHDTPLLEPRVPRDSVESALATALLLAGKLEDAIAFADRAMSGPAEPSPTALLRALGTKSLALAWQGDEAPAAELAQEAQSVLDRSEVESNDPFLVHLAVAWTRSDPGRAHASLLFVRQLARRSGLESFQGLAELAAARSAVATSNRPAAARAYRTALDHTAALEDPGILVKLGAIVQADMEAMPQPDECALSRREIQVLGQLASGATRSEVAETLHLSVETVKTHLRRAYRKLGVDTKETALQRAAALGIIADPPEAVRLAST